MKIEFTNVKQPDGSKICAICVASMITHRTVDELIEEFGCDYTSQYHAYWSERRLRICLATYDWVHGAVCHSLEPTRFTAGLRIEFPDRWDNFPCLLVVESKKLKLKDGTPANHIILYDHNHKKIRDSSSKEEFTDLADYMVLEFIPLQKILPYEGAEL